MPPTESSRYAPSRYYFALARLLAAMKGSRPEQTSSAVELELIYRPAQNSVEAIVVSLIIWLLTASWFFAHAVELENIFLRWSGAVVSPFVPFLFFTVQTILVWMVFAPIRALTGLFRGVKDGKIQRPAQLVLLTLWAVLILCYDDGAARVVGYVWLGMIALECTAQLVVLASRRQLAALDERLRS